MKETHITILLGETPVFLSANDSIEELLGFKAEEFVNANVNLIDRIHSGDKNIADMIFSTNTNQASATFNIRLRKANGKICCVKGSYTKKFDNKDQHILLEISLYDAKKLWQSSYDGSSYEQNLTPNFKAMMENTTDYICFKDHNHVFTGASQTFVKLTNPSKHGSHLLGLTDYDIFPEQYADAYYELEKQVFAGIKVAHEEQEILDNEGKKSWIDNYKYPIQDQQGEIIGLFGIAKNITKLKESEAKFRKVFEKTDAISVQGYNKDHQVIYWNPASEKIYGYSAKEALGKKLEDLIIPDEIQDQVRTGVDNWINGGDEIPSSELTLKKANGTPVHVFSSHVMMREKNKDPELYCIDIDLSVHKEQADKIRHQAFFDSLTDLPNRLLVLDRLKQQIKEAKRNNKKLAVLFLDLDDFKRINDSLGHETGDILLIESSKRISSIVRDKDTVGRFGGDEFIILLGDLASAKDALPIVKNLLDQFRKLFKINSRDFRITISAGIAIYPDDGQNSSDLLRKADSAMYNAKRQGRNTFSYFTQSMNHKVLRNLELEEQLHDALLKGEFEVYYQPKVKISNGKIIGAEALLRWDNPILGKISPVEFIPVCEHTGLIIPIGKFVLEQALTQTLQWQHEIQSDFHIAINLSPSQFRAPLLIENIKDIIKIVNISTDYIELEITEGVLMNANSYINNAINSLSNMGISIAMDDFGTGYSSLSYLRRYPFNILKIDRSFISDITCDSADKELVNATIAMAHALKIKVVAEGVETEEQLELLKEMNCDIAQGYLYSQPIPARDFTKLLEAEKYL
jgi:diguanylate cyclase (GGDEF)-like protein/PAS domain S-box-containing protein